MDTARNTLETSASRFLRQHSRQPLHWQEWSLEAVETAAMQNKPIFATIGYSSCHLCHEVLATEFTDPDIVAVLNNNCVCILIDREQRPDIDQYLADFLLASTGNITYPYHVFLSPEIKPVHAFCKTCPDEGRNTRQILDMIQDTLRLYKFRSSELSRFTVEWDSHKAKTSQDPVAAIKSDFDPVHGGFGYGQQYPPYSTLLFLLYLCPEKQDREIDFILTKTLDAMAMGGLHDHINGGFFRYCTDREWMQPQFEKLLIDQALNLWIYSLAERRFPGRGYAAVAFGVIRSLENQFRLGSCYGTSIDASSEGIEGGRILWSADELAAHISNQQRTVLNDLYKFTNPLQGIDRYLITAKKNLHNRNSAQAALREHMRLVKQGKPRIELDSTVLTDVNSILGIAFIIASRNLKIPYLTNRAFDIFFSLERTMHRRSWLYHSSSSTSDLMPSRYARDAASFTLLADYLFEQSFAMEQYYNSAFSTLMPFYSGDRKWMEASSPDFLPLPASSFDHPYPSTLGLIEMVEARREVRHNRLDSSSPYHPGLQQDFINISSMIRRGGLLAIYSDHEIDTMRIPMNAMVLPARKTEKSI
ncbi:DUF255 domain-containing protein [Spirochaeta dissipatitropha]